MCAECLVLRFGPVVRRAAGRLRAAPAQEVRRAQAGGGGCSPHEIQVITGHKTLRMVEKDAEDTNEQRQASAAILKLKAAAGRPSGKRGGKETRD